MPRRVTWHSSYTDDPQRLGATVYNLIARATRRQGFVHPRCITVQVSIAVFIHFFRTAIRNFRFAEDSCLLVCYFFFPPVGSYLLFEGAYFLHLQGRADDGLFDPGLILSFSFSCVSMYSVVSVSTGSLWQRIFIVESPSAATSCPSSGLFPFLSRPTYLLTPWCRVLLTKLTGLQLVKKFPAFHGTRRFITALTSVRQLSLS